MSSKQIQLAIQNLRKEIEFWLENAALKQEPIDAKLILQRLLENYCSPSRYSKFEPLNRFITKNITTRHHVNFAESLLRKIPSHSIDDIIKELEKYLSQLLEQKQVKQLKQESHLYYTLIAFFFYYPQLIDKDKHPTLYEQCYGSIQAYKSRLMKQQCLAIANGILSELDKPYDTLMGSLALIEENWHAIKSYNNLMDSLELIAENWHAIKPYIPATLHSQLFSKLMLKAQHARTSSITKYYRIILKMIDEGLPLEQQNALLANMLTALTTFSSDYDDISFINGMVDFLSLFKKLYTTLATELKHKLIDELLTKANNFSQFPISVCSCMVLGFCFQYLPLESKTVVVNSLLACLSKRPDKAYTVFNITLAYNYGAYSALKMIARQLPQDRCSTVAEQLFIKLKTKWLFENNVACKVVGELLGTVPRELQDKMIEQLLAQLKAYQRGGGRMDVKKSQGNTAWRALIRGYNNTPVESQDAVKHALVEYLDTSDSSLFVVEMEVVGITPDDFVDVYMDEEQLSPKTKLPIDLQDAILNKLGILIGIFESNSPIYYGLKTLRYLNTVSNTAITQFSEVIEKRLKSKNSFYDAEFACSLFYQLQRTLPLNLAILIFDVCLLSTDPYNTFEKKSEIMIRYCKIAPAEAIVYLFNKLKNMPENEATGKVLAHLLGKVDSSLRQQVFGLLLETCIKTGRYKPLLRILPLATEPEKSLIRPHLEKLYPLSTHHITGTQDKVLHGKDLIDNIYTATTICEFKMLEALNNDILAKSCKEPLNDRTRNDIGNCINTFIMT